MAKKVIWAEGCFGNICPNGTLKSIDGATHGGEVVLGTIPADINFVSFFFSLSFEGGILGFGPDNAGAENDIFFVDPNQANSLKRITNTPDFSELVIAD